MTATNHALTGAVIGLAVGNPAAALVALGSHFVLDAVPHYTDNKAMPATSSAFKKFLTLDLALCVLFAFSLTMLRPEHWFLACWCAFLATSPDLMWLPPFLKAGRMGRYVNPTHTVAKFHSWIQWCARPWGKYVELVWAVAMVLLLAKLT